MGLVVLLCSLSGFPSGARPIDAFYANYGGVKVDLEIRYVSGTLSVDAVKSLMEFDSPRVSMSETPASLIVGRWSCDGVSEHSVLGSPGEGTDQKVEPLARSSSGFSRMESWPLIESLFDGVTLAEHQLGQTARPVLNVWQHGISDFAPSRKGLFGWWEYPFAYYLQVRFPGVSPVIETGTVGGSTVIVETYERPTSKGRALLEVAYDPNWSFTPRRLRNIVVSPNETSYVRETYVLDCRKARAGGFVPMEWYNVVHPINNFQKTHSDYSYKTIFGLDQSEYAGLHFLVTEFQDRSSPVELVELKSVKSISAPGGIVPLPVVYPRMRLAQLKSMLGRKLYQSAPRPTPDFEELVEFDDRTGLPWSLVFGLTVFIFGMLTAVRFMRRRHSRSATMILLALLGPFGCAQESEEEPMVVASLKGPVILYDGSPDTIPMELKLKNHGRHGVRVIGLDGGCTCREVDPGQFPFDLLPQDEHELTLRYSPGRSPHKGLASFTMITNKGRVPLSAPIYPIPKIQIEPGTIHHMGIEDEEVWEFEFVYRNTVPIKTSFDEVRLPIPEDFEVIGDSTHEGVVPDASELKFRERTMKLVLRNQMEGLQKRVIAPWRGNSQLSPALSVVWKRMPYLSSMPSQVSLAEKPVRVFLQCPDPSVELTKILSTPRGVQAHLTSPHEFVVSVTPEAEPKFTGEILVETTAVGSKPLGVKVVRYSLGSTD